MFELLGHPIYGIGFMALLGACVGSFLNVVILRMPVMLQNSWRGQCAELLAGDFLETENPPIQVETSGERFNLNYPPSHCPSCDQRLKWWHNIPIVSYLLLKGKCGWCDSTIGARYPLIEAITAVATVHMALHFGIGWPLLAALFFLWALIALTVIDLDHQLLPDAITLPLLWAGLLANLFGLFTTIEAAVIGAIAGYLTFWTIFQVHFRLTGREGLGYGDFKLLAAIGAWAGWELLPITILIASLSGTLFAVSLLLFRKANLRAPMSFGPFLAVAGWIALIWGDQIVATALPLFAF